MTLIEQIEALKVLSSIAKALEEVQNANISKESLETINSCLVFVGDMTGEALESSMED